MARKEKFLFHNGQKLVSIVVKSLETAEGEKERVKGPVGSNWRKMADMFGAPFEPESR